MTVSNTNNITSLLLTALLARQQQQPAQATQASTALTGSNPLAALLGLGGIPQAAGTSSLAAYPQVQQQQNPIAQLLFTLVILQLVSKGQGGSNNLLDALRKLFNITPPQPALFEGGGQVAKGDIDALIDKYKTANTDGVTEAQVDKAITENAVTTAPGMAARALKAVFSLFAIQEGNIDRISKEDASRFLKLNGKNDVLSSAEQVGERVTPAQATAIQKYITQNTATLNEFGDKKGTTYAAGKAPTLVTLANNQKAIYIGTNGNNGIYLSPEAYFVFKNPDWRNLIKNLV